MVNFLLDPALFNRVIIALFILAAIRWAVAGNWAQCAYWAAGAVLNLAVLAMVRP